MKKPNMNRPELKNFFAKYSYPNNGHNPPDDLVVGEMYPVEAIEMSGWHTDIKLAGKDGYYNSVNFDFFENGKPVDIYSHPACNPYL